jgi:hypothetical protein
MSPAGPPLALAQSALGLLASEESASPVGGTIQDQAFMDGVARQLQTLRVPVIMPADYSPYSLMPLDHKDSPFLASLERTLEAEGCLNLLATDPNRTDKVSIQVTVTEIETFRATLGEIALPGTKTEPPQTVKPAGGGSPSAPSAGTPPSTATAAPPSTHLVAVLSADGLAESLGVDPATGNLPDNGTPPHVLLVKALESGGTVLRNSNILGTKVRYSGGSVGTYALFTTDGYLECSGNVYEYGGAFKAKDFQRGMRTYVPDPAKQLIFQRGSCRPSDRSQ